VTDDGSRQRKPNFRTAVEDLKAVTAVLAREAQSVLGRRTARFLGVLVLFAVVGGLLVWYIAPSSAAQKQALVVTLAQILAGTALLSGLYFTWRTLQVNREGQITERFTRAIDQLGSEKLEIGLGGIYSLERIARESEEDHWPIMEVLAAYVRQHAHWRPEEGAEDPEEAAFEKESEGGSREQAEPTEVLAPGPDIQAIMSVLRRRTRSYGHGEPERLDLRETNLTKADLTGANLTGADLTGANLTGADLREAILTGADLRGAILTEADFRSAILREANLREANIMRANLTGADLTAAILREANLTGADLTGADLREANLTGADLRGAILRKANLRAASFTVAGIREAILRAMKLTEEGPRGALLTEADFRGLKAANLTRADFTGADLTGADLREADLTEAILWAANLTGANLTKEQLQQATSLDFATMPDGSKRD